MIAEVLDALGLDKVDLVANDSGGAIAQIFAAHRAHHSGTRSGGDRFDCRGMSAQSRSPPRPPRRSS
jgi:pimeloyl-ACP methyl ester carboxylesterase